MAERVTLSLVSHTNVGKTTLARTLLRRDVGEVLDQAHVTEVSESFTLIEVPGGELRLWDTPGFGDSVRLLERLRRRANPIAWFLQQVWDRVTDRPLWCSQQAALNIQQEADVVLYLVSAAEAPEEAGYVAPELELLSWIGRPVLLLLNQTGEADGRAERGRRTVARWRTLVGRWPAVHGVLPLDAFSRCWVEEGLLFERVAELLPEAKRPVMERLRGAWERRNLEVFERSVEALATYLASAGGDLEELPSRRPSRADKRRAMERLGERLEAGTEGLMGTLLTLHGLEGGAAGELQREVDAFVVRGEERLPPEKGALLGGVVSGALGGLAADFFAGGLTFGGGMVAGAILGALGGAGLARGYDLVMGERRPAVSWSPAFLDRLAVQALLRYLAVAHYGRGRGALRRLEETQRWRSAVEGVLRQDAARWAALWRRLERAAERGAAERELHGRLAGALRQLLVDAYPGAARLLRGSSGGGC